LKFDKAKFGTIVDDLAQSRPTLEELAEQMEANGFGYVDAERRPLVLSYRRGRDFVDDPIVRFMIASELVNYAGQAAVDEAMAYVRDAVDKYWSDGLFELTVQVGCVTGRKTR
jgi:hypothetical protein